MGHLGNKGFSFWLVPSGDGRVRKIRLSLPVVLAIGLVCFVVTSGFVFMASDYARVQVLKARNFLSLKSVSAERDKLAATKHVLQSEVDKLKEANDKAASYQKQVKERMDELASILRGVESLGMPLAGLESPIKNNKDDAVGGGEVPCKGKGSKCLRFTKQANDLEDDVKASLNPKFVIFSNEQKANSNLTEGIGEVSDKIISGQNLLEGNASMKKLVSLIDHYVEVLRTVPLGSPANGYLNSGFGLRISPFGDGLTMHEGLDYNMPTGSMVNVTADGVVKEVKYHSTYGLVVDIQHSNRVITRYAHLSKALVTPGEKVCRGEAIGLAGSTGRSTGSHVHYEVIVDGTARDPIKFVRLASKLSSIVG